ncbi:MAG: glycosyltransferase family 61 protein [Oscillospiraceae bacterium]|nr:glycosyltransferase family 61 protein [Oscillospiraceae bacterium]
MDSRAKRSSLFKRIRRNLCNKNAYIYVIHKIFHILHKIPFFGCLLRNARKQDCTITIPKDMIHEETLHNFRLYTKNACEHSQYLKTDLNIKKTLTVNTIENGVILPLRNHPGSQSFCGKGGVCDSDGNFVAGHKTHPEISLTGLFVDEAYPLPIDIPYVDETVVYGGLFYVHFGHFITESLSRMWYFVENQSCRYRYVFITPESHFPESSHLIEYLYMLGLNKDDIIILREPTRFRSIIIPDQSTYIYAGFRPGAMQVFNSIRNSIPPAKYDKVYFTRAKFRSYQHDIQDTTNEEYFENYFRTKGFDIIAPEQLSIRQQVAIMAGAKEYACVSGSLHHHILFGGKKLKATILNRSHCSMENAGMRVPMQWVSQMTECPVTIVDVYANFLPTSKYSSIYLLMPGIHWKAYIKDEFNDYGVKVTSSEVNGKVAEYIEKWCNKMIIETGSTILEGHSEETFADFIINYNDYILNNNMEDTTVQKLRDIFG